MSRRVLQRFLLSALFLPFATVGHAEPFPAVFHLDSLEPGNGGDGTSGVVISRDFAGYGGRPARVGYSVAAAGDVNADGIRDIVLGAGPAENNRGDLLGDPAVYLVLGGEFAGAAELELEDLLESQTPQQPPGWGYAFDATVLGDLFGLQFPAITSQRVAGDIDWNGDGVSDFVAGLYAEDSVFANYSTLVIFPGWNTPTPPATLDTALVGGESFAAFPGRYTVARNVVAADSSSFLGGFVDDDRYIEFAPMTVRTNSTGPAANLTIVRTEATVYCTPPPYGGIGAGDVNGDGRDDVIVVGMVSSTRCIEFEDSQPVFYLLLGGDWLDSYGFVSPVFIYDRDLPDVRANVVPLPGGGINLASITAAGDVNADGYNDVLIYNERNDSDRGGYVVFGRSGDFGDELDLGKLVAGYGERGFALRRAASPHAHWRIPPLASIVGDINGDGADDMFAFLPARNRGYVLYGRSTGFPGEVDLDALIETGDPVFGFEVVVDGDGPLVPPKKILGDVNGDGIDDLLLGAPHYDTAANVDSGRAYVVFGRRLTDSDGDGMPDSFELANDLDPQNPNDAGLDPDGDGRSNLAEYQAGGDPFADDVPPRIDLPPDIEAVATGTLTDIDLGQAVATDGLDGPVTAMPVDPGPYPSGRNVITWRAEDAAGNVGTADQTVDITPIFEMRLSPDPVFEGESGVLTISLSGPPIRYPVVIRNTVGGSTSSQDFVSRWVTWIDIDSGLEASAPFETRHDDIIEGRETFTVSVQRSVHAVVADDTPASTTVTDENSAPTVTIAVDQANAPATTLAADAGPVRVDALIVDRNGRDVHTLDWSESSAAVQPAAPDASFTIDPSSISAGLYRLEATVVDNGIPPLTSSAESLVRLVASAPILDPTVDTDGDGTSDADEGFGDSDGDRIPDYLDASSDPTQLPADDSGAVLRTTAGNSLQLGATAFASGAAHAEVSLQDIADFGGPDGSAAANADDPDFEYPLGVFDFEVEGLTPGDQTSVVIPLAAPIPAGARYRKFLQADGWSDFVVDAANDLFTALGQSGACPDPSSADYVAGLKAGHRCVRLTIEDGGPNDADRRINGRIADPGGVAVALPAVSPPPAPTTSRGGGGGAVSVLWLLMLAAFAQLQRERRG